MAIAMASALVADLGGTQIRVALVDEEGRISGRRSMPTRADEGRDRVVDRLLSVLKQATDVAGRGSLLGVGVSLASPTDPKTGVMYNPPNLPGWHGFSLKPVLEQSLSLPVSLANDATLAALAEHVHGAGRGYRDLIYMTLSTGIGGGIVVGGRLYTGAGGFAGEVGHITIDRNGPLCNCGNIGCLEAMASGTAVARMAREKLANDETSVLHERSGGDPDSVDARMVADAARSGDELAQGVMAEVGRNLGVGIVSLLHAFDPEVIVLGGGLSGSLDLLMPQIAQEVETHAMAHQRSRVPVVRSELGDDVSLMGAAALAFEASRQAS